MMRVILGRIFTGWVSAAILATAPAASFAGPSEKVTAPSQSAPTRPSKQVVEDPYTRYLKLIGGRGPALPPPDELASLLIERGFTVPAERQRGELLKSDRLLAVALLSEFMLRPRIMNAGSESHQARLIELNERLWKLAQRPTQGSVELVDESWLPFDRTSVWLAVESVASVEPRDPEFRETRIRNQLALNQVLSGIERELEKERQRLIRGEPPTVYRNQSNPVLSIADPERFRMLISLVQELYMAVDFLNRVETPSPYSPAGQSHSGLSLVAALHEMVVLRATQIDQWIRTAVWPDHYDAFDRIREPIFGSLNRVHPNIVDPTELNRSASLSLKLKSPEKRFEVGAERSLAVLKLGLGEHLPKLTDVMDKCATSFR